MRAESTAVVAIDGQLLCVQRGPTGGWCVHRYRVDEASRHFVLTSSLDVRGALGGEASDVELSTAELVAADAVTDTAASLQTVALAFRRRRGATHDFWLGTVRLEPPASASAASWHAFELAEVEAQVLTDGPALVMVHAVIGGGHALSVASLASAGGVRLRTVPLPGRASLLGATSWSGAADDLHALLVLRTAEGDGQQVLALRLPADDDDRPPAAADHAVGGAAIGGDAGAARGGATASGSTAGGGGTAGSGGGAAGGGVLAGRAVPALDALASRVVCAAPDWRLDIGQGGALRRTLRLWVGTSCGWLHCCGGGDEPAPLVSLAVDVTPRRLAVLSLQHGGPTIALLGHAPAAPEAPLLLLLSAKGERLRLLRDVRDFVPHDFLRAGHAQLLLLQGRARLAGSLQRLAMRSTPEAVATAAAAAPPPPPPVGAQLAPLCGYALVGLRHDFCSVADRNGADGAAPSAAAVGGAVGGAAGGASGGVVGVGAGGAVRGAQLKKLSAALGERLAEGRRQLALTEARQSSRPPQLLQPLVAATAALSSSYCSP